MRAYKTGRFEAIRVECATANRRLPGTGLVDLTFGNVSVLDADAGVFAIKPSGVDYGELTPDNMVIVNLDGQVVEGSLRPSSDTPTHRGLYLAFARHGIRSIVHTHSHSAVAFAQAARAIPCLGTTHADYFRGAVPVTRQMTPEEVDGDYEWETAGVIIERFAEIRPAEVPSILVRNHGPFCWGPNAWKALETAQALEAIATMAIKTLALNPEAQETPPYLLDRHFLRKHGKDAYYGQDSPEGNQ
ncbi:MAG: L-ribulose-5-phosphate 4-epimerase [Rhodothermales bacterium]|jgi:L-ribulose-5-phosphate 4-epimerase